MRRFNSNSLCASLLTLLQIVVLGYIRNLWEDINYWVGQYIMNVTEVFRLINNLDYDEGLKRKFGPKYSLMQLDKHGEIVAVYRFKEAPSEEQQVEALKKHRGTIQIPAMVGMYETIESLKVCITDSMPLFSSLKK